MACVRGRRQLVVSLEEAVIPKAAEGGFLVVTTRRIRHCRLAAGGSEPGLMAMAGWTRVEMLIRYTRARASERAAAEARRLDLGNL
jgi:hypothetical protein